MKRYLAIILVCIMCLTVFSACSSDKSSNNGASKSGTTSTFGLTPFETRQTLRVGFFSGSAHSSPFYIADQKKFFDELNIDVEYVPFTNGPAMMEASSSWDIASVGAPGVLVGQLGHNVKMIGAADYEENLALFVRKDSKLLSKNAEDWKNSTWLYPTGTSLHLTLIGELTKLGLGISDVKSINMDVASALTAFKAGQGDGLCIWNSLAYTAEDAGYVRVDDAGTLGIVSLIGVVSTDQALSEKRDLVKTAWEVYYLTHQWSTENDANKAEAAALFLESCENDGIACNESVAKRTMDVYKCPSVSKAIDVMTKTSADDKGLYTTRQLLQGEKDLLVTLDFLISQGKYSNSDRSKILDGNMVDNSIAKECSDNLKSLNITIK